DCDGGTPVQVGGEGLEGGKADMKGDKELAGFLKARDSGRPPCHAVRAAAQRLLKEMDEQLGGKFSLSEIRSAIAQAAARSRARARPSTWLARRTTWPARHGNHIGRRAIDAHEPAIAVLLCDLEAPRQK